MDDGCGNFIPLTDEKLVKMGIVDQIDPQELMRRTLKKFEDQPHIFAKGEELEIKGSRFKIQAIGRKTMTLKLLPRLEDLEDAIDREHPITLGKSIDEILE